MRHPLIPGTRRGWWSGGLVAVAVLGLLVTAHEGLPAGPVLAVGGALLALLVLAVAAGSMWRGSVRAGSGAHGTARFAERRELEAAGFLSAEGPVLGWVPGRGGRWTPVRYSGFEPVLVVGNARSGKTSGSLIPTILSAEGHVVALDVKRDELYRSTSGCLAKRGYRVIRISPLDLTGARWNPLQEVEPGPEEILDLAVQAEAVYSAEREDGNEHFRKNAEALWTCLALHLLYSREEEASLARLREVVTTLVTPDGELAKGSGAFFEKLSEARHDPHRLFGWVDERGTASATHPEVHRLARHLAKVEKRELASILTTTRTQLDPWRSEVVAWNTSVSEVYLRRIRRSPDPVAVYFCCDRERLSVLVPLLRLFVGTLARALRSPGEYRDVGARSGVLPVQVVMDEVPQLQRLEAIPLLLATMGGEGVRFLLGAQTRSQLLRIWGRTESVMSACPVWVITGSQDPELLDLASRLSGRTTVHQERTSRPALGLGHGTVSEVESSRPLLEVGEIRSMDPREALLLASGLHPFRMRKIGAHEISWLRRKTLLPPVVLSQHLEDPADPWSTPYPLRRDLDWSRLVPVGEGTDAAA